MSKFFNAKKTAAIIGAQITGIVLSCAKGKTKKAKVAGVIASLAAGEVASYALTRHEVKKFDPNASYSVAEHYKTAFNMGLEAGRDL